MEKILITGILGSGGTFLAKYLSETNKNNFLFGLGRSHSGFQKNEILSKISNLKFFDVDMNDYTSLHRSINKIKPTKIFNLASNANVRSSFDNPISIFENNTKSCLNLFEVIRNLNLSTKIVHCSTSEVYGQILKSEVPVNENQPFRPASPYAVSKIAQDMFSETYFKNFGLNIIRTRMFTYINPLREDLFATSFAKQIVEIELGKRRILKHGNLKSVRTIVDIRDAMNAYWLAMNKCKPGEIYNIGGKNFVSVGEFLDILISKSNSKIKTNIDQNLLRPTDVTLQIPNIDKFYKETRWKPKYSLEESVDYLLNFWRARLNA